MVSIIFLAIAVVVLFRLSLPLLILLGAAIYIKPDWFFSCLNSIGLNNTAEGRRFVSAMRSCLPGNTSIEALPDAHSTKTVPTSFQPLANPVTSHKNISYVDEMLIGLGIVGIILSALALYGQLASGALVSNLALILSLSVLLTSIGLLLLGIISRRREKTCLRLLTLMQHTSGTQISVLMNQSRFTIDSLRRSVSTINSAGIGFLVLDEQSDRLYDGRLQARITLSHDCTGCGASSEITIDIQAEQEVACIYCSSPFPVELINALRQQRRQSVSAERQAAGEQNAVKQRHLLAAESAPKFSVGKLLLLGIFFWPGALVYVANYHLSNKAHASRLQALISQQTTQSRGRYPTPNDDRYALTGRQ